MSKIISINDTNIQPVKEHHFSGATIFFYVFTVFLFGFVIYYFPDIRGSVKLLTRVNFYWLTAAIVAQLLTYWVSAVIYRLLLRASGVKDIRGTAALYKASVISLFFNQTVPSAGISGNTYLFNFLLRRNLDVSTILGLILAELLIFYASIEGIIVFFLIAGLFFFPLPVTFISVLAGGAFLYLLFGLVITLLGQSGSIEKFYKRLEKSRIIKKVFVKLSQRLHHQKVSGENLIVFMNTQKKAVLYSFVLQLIVFLLDVLTIMTLFYGLGLSVGFYPVLLALICTKIISLLPFSPGALVLYESSMTFFFTELGIPVGTALMVTLIFMLLTFWFPIPAGLYLYRRWIQRTETS